MDRVRKVLSWPLLAFIRFYQRFLSPLKPPVCRYHPTCSSYAHQAIVLHGPVKGTALATQRILRCSPLFHGGLDPVPESPEEQKLIADGAELVGTSERRKRLHAACDHPHH